MKSIEFKILLQCPIGDIDEFERWWIQNSTYVLNTVQYKYGRRAKKIPPLSELELAEYKLAKKKEKKEQVKMNKTSEQIAKEAVDLAWGNIVAEKRRRQKLHEEYMKGTECTCC